jgi:hypothetical protein
MASLQQLCMDVVTSSMEWQQDFLLLNVRFLPTQRAPRRGSRLDRAVYVQALDSSIANKMMSRLLTAFELKPQHLTFFADAATELHLDDVTLLGPSPDNGEWCQYAMYWR